MGVRRKISMETLSFYTLIVLLAISAILVFCRIGTGQLGGSTVAGAPKELPAEEKTYSILIDTEDRRLYLLCNGKLVKSYICAVGKSETPSPLGTYKIVEKSRWGKGFGGYWMGLNCPWGRFGIHGTTKPSSIGRPVSHGCIRMYNKDVAELYKTVPKGTQVTITGGCYGVFGSGFRVIKPSMYGLDVKAVQMRLKEDGYFYGDCTGVYNTQDFKRAIHKFQIDHGLPVSDEIDKSMLSALGFVIMD